MITLDSLKFYDVDFVGGTGGGVSYFNGGILNRMKAVIELTCFRGLEDVDLVFDSATKKITYDPTTGYYNFKEQGWDNVINVEVDGTSSNDGSYTIAEVSDFYIIVNESVVNETAAACNLYDATPVTDIDLYYNLVRSVVTPQNYSSLSDLNAIQRYTATGLDASDTGTTVSFKVNSSSFGWVSNPLTGSTDALVTIIGDGITDFRQSFIIEQTFSVALFWRAEFFQNFVNGIMPQGYYPQKYVCRIDARAGTANVLHTGVDEQTNGTGTWFDQNNIGGLPDVYVDQVIYNNGDTDVLDFTIDNTVAIVLKSRGGLFQTGGPNTKFAIDFLYCSLDPNRYTNTGERTLRQNLLNDRVVIATNSAATDGEFFGTAYQVLEDVQVSTFAAGSVTIVLSVNFSDEIKELLSSVGDNDRLYAFAITTQDITITTSAQSSRVAVLCDYQNMVYDRRDADLLEVSNFQCYNFPNLSAGNHDMVIATEGQPVLVRVPFTVAVDEVDGVQPVLTNSAVAVVAVKSGEDDFVLDSFTIDAANAKRIDTAQYVNTTISRNFASPAGPYNEASLVRYGVLDTSTKAGYLFSFGFAFRYEDWYSLVPNPFNLVNANEQWSELIGDGWTLKVRFTATVKGYDGFDTNFVAYTDMELAESNIESDVKFYNEAGLEVETILIGERTLIKTTFTGDLVPPMGTTNLYGFLFLDYIDTGGVAKRRTINSYSDSEQGSPFTAGFADPNADFNYSSDNAMLNVYINPLDPTDITAEMLTWYDETVDSWGANGLQPVVGVQAGFLGTYFHMILENGNGMLYEDGNQMIYETL